MMRTVLQPVGRAALSVGKEVSKEVGKEWLQKKAVKVGLGANDDPTLARTPSFLLTGRKPLPTPRPSVASPLASPAALLNPPNTAAPNATPKRNTGASIARQNQENQENSAAWSNLRPRSANNQLITLGGRRRSPSSSRSHGSSSKSSRDSKLCSPRMTFQECELAILRAAVDRADTRLHVQMANAPEVKDIIGIVETFLRDKQLVCYGGTAINNLLPREDQFYRQGEDIADYDFYSHQALADAKALADLYARKGYTEVEAKAGQHHGTFKVFVNFIPVADITSVPAALFRALKKESVQVAGIRYAPPNFLRMAMYLELSRPAGDVSRWEKVLKRLTLLNKHYPLTGRQCLSFQRDLEEPENRDQAELIYDVVQQTLVDQGVVFFGGYALSLYAQYMPPAQRQQVRHIPDFDVLAENPRLVAEVVRERLQENHVRKVSIVERPGVGEVIAPHYELKVDKDTVAFLYEPMACHSYNEIRKQGRTVKVATIDTMLSFWLAFLYADRPYYDKDRILCMASFLFEVQEKNRLAQKGLLRRFSIDCLGHQETVEEMRAAKSEKFAELRGNRQSPEYEEWFLRYRPADVKPSAPQTNKTNKTKTSHKRSTDAPKGPFKTASGRGRKTQKQKRGWGFF